MGGESWGAGERGLEAQEGLSRWRTKETRAALLLQLLPLLSCKGAIAKEELLGTAAKAGRKRLLRTPSLGGAGGDSGSQGWKGSGPQARTGMLRPSGTKGCPSVSQKLPCGLLQSGNIFPPNPGEIDPIGPCPSSVAAGADFLPCPT